MNLSSWFSSNNIQQILYSVPALLIALSFHEFAHAYVSYKLGDDTAKNMGRLTVNPLAHLDFLGTICLILLRFGWAKPVGINPNKFKNRRSGMLLTALAGPAMNFLLALISGFLYFILKYMLFASSSSVAAMVFVNIVYYIFVYNAFLCVFNLIPLPPLDGSKVLASMFPQKLEYKFYQYEKYMYFALLILIFTGMISRIMSVLGVGLINFIWHFIINILG